MTFTLWIDPSVARVGIWAIVAAGAIFAVVYLRRELFPPSLPTPNQEQK